MANEKQILSKLNAKKKKKARLRRTRYFYNVNSILLRKYINIHFEYIIVGVFGASRACMTKGT